MTDAKLRPNPSAGHGLEGDLVDRIYEELSKGKRPADVPCLVLLRAVEHGERLTADGRKRLVRFEAVRLEPVTDEAEGTRLIELMVSAYEDRHVDGQEPLSLGLSEADGLLTVLDEWRKEKAMSAKAFGEEWRDYFAGNPDSPKDHKVAAPAFLREFALAKGALPDE